MVRPPQMLTKRHYFRWSDRLSSDWVLVYVRYIYQEDVHEDMLCALLLPTNTTNADCSSCWMVIYQENWNGPRVGICTDWPAAMIGQLSFLTAWIKKVAPNCNSIHCIIYREMLANQKMPPELNSMLNDIVNVINHIKAQALNPCLFEQLCEELNAEHRHLLLYIEIRWLFQG